jgi:hypothetical protein
MLAAMMGTPVHSSFECLKLYVRSKLTCDRLFSVDLNVRIEGGEEKRGGGRQNPDAKVPLPFGSNQDILEVEFHVIFDAWHLGTCDCADGGGGTRCLGLGTAAEDV